MFLVSSGFTLGWLGKVMYTQQVQLGAHCTASTSQLIRLVAVRLLLCPSTVADVQNLYGYQRNTPQYRSVSRLLTTHILWLELIRLLSLLCIVLIQLTPSACGDGSVCCRRSALTKLWIRC